MAAFLNPTQSLVEIADVFERGASNGGVSFDADLCRHFVDGLRDAAGGVEQLVAFAQEHGLVHALGEDRDRTPAERQRLARLAVPLDPEGRVLSFPQAPARLVTVTEGGTAA